MNIVLFAHPSLLGSVSMPRFANMLAKGFREKGYSVNIWTAQAFLSKVALPNSIRKWLGYIDQFFIFPIIARKKIKKEPADTIFVLTDHALGPWMKMIRRRPHVIHCHDFLAQQSALGLIAGVHTKWSGKIYQSYIRNGFRMGKYFISVSHKTQNDLNSFLQEKPLLSEVVYNGFNQDFTSLPIAYARQIISNITHLDLSNGYILHVGGNQWYKNREGVLHMYINWRKNTANSCVMLMVGKPPNVNMKQIVEQSGYKNDIVWLEDASEDELMAAYSGALFLLFPSFAEGFGWPIVEAMALSCPVLTTNSAPMNEVGANAAFYFPLEELSMDTNQTMPVALSHMEYLSNLSGVRYSEIVTEGLKNAQRFDTDTMIEQLETMYLQILDNYK